MSDLPRQNIEVKARLPDMEGARAVCRRIDASFQGVLNQIDTYFRARDGGRLKLRQINNERAELITYTRPNIAASRSSHYQIEPVADARITLAALGDTLGVLCIVRKRRELFMWQNVRIHLDQVEGLGTFIEFEGVISGEADEAISRERVSRLVEEFGISPGDQIGVSYSDLLCVAEPRRHEGTK
jgi:adenylate cyclase, class 2